MILYLILSLLAIAGCCDAFAETLKFHPSHFFKRYPNANLDFWLIGDSWDNKWKNGDPNQGEKFWQSSRALVSLTDGYHLMRMIKNQAITIGLTILLIPHIHKPMNQYLIAALTYICLYFIYTGFFSLIFDKWFKK